MTLGIRGRLFAVSLLLICTGGVASGAYLMSALRADLERRVQRELLRHARAVARTVEGLDAGASRAALDSLVDRLAGAVQARITLIDGRGTVRADSSLPLEHVLDLDNHAGRPEVRAARREGVGVSRRFSTTLQTDMLYVALAAESEGLVVRVSRPLDDVDRAVGQLRLLLILAGIIGLAVAVLMSGFASHLLSRELRALADRVRFLLGGADDTGARDEVGRLEGSFDRMSRDLQNSVQELGEERDRLQTVLAGMREAVIALDDRRNVTLLNDAARDMLLLDSGALGRPLVDVVRHPSLIELASRGSGSETLEISRSRGPTRYLLARAAPLQTTGGVVLVLLDITELRRLENVRRDFVANVSHELRTPISVIRANAETLRDGALDDPQAAARFLDALVRNAERLGRIVSELLDLSRIESGQLPLELGPVSIGEAGRRAWYALGTKVGSKELSFDVDPELRVRGDARALDQILLNLFDNAVKYADGAGVQLRARFVGRQVRVEVQDEGPGLSPEQRARVFERFYRVDKGRSSQVEGSGLGLAIVKHLVVAMGGQIGVEPVPAGGTSFWFTLPASDDPVHRHAS